MSHRRQWHICALTLCINIDIAPKRRIERQKNLEHVRRIRMFFCPHLGVSSMTMGRELHHMTVVTTKFVSAEVEDNTYKYLCMYILSTYRYRFITAHSHSAFNNTMGSLRRKEKVVVVMGATGTGKSRLSIDLADFFPAEVINSDKIQIYRGLDTTTNKISSADRRSVPHRLLGDLDPAAGELSPSHFRLLAAGEINSMSSRRKLPIVVGGSNSFIHALVVDRFDPSADVFSGDSPVASELRYGCCFIWVDVSFAVLSDYLSQRVDDMLDSGMFEELADFFTESAARTGLGKAIGVPEFDKYFLKYPPGRFGFSRPDGSDSVRAGAYEEAVREVKENTRQLVKRQMGKIQRLRDAGWDLKRVDATEAFRAVAAADSGRRWPEIWERQVVEKSVKIVKRFLKDE